MIFTAPSSLLLQFVILFIHSQDLWGILEVGSCSPGVELGSIILPSDQILELSSPFPMTHNAFDFIFFIWSTRPCLWECSAV